MRDPHEGTVKRAVDTVPFHLDHDSSFICIIHVNIFYVFTFCFSFLILKVFTKRLFLLPPLKVFY